MKGILGRLLATPLRALWVAAVAVLLNAAPSVLPAGSLGASLGAGLRCSRASAQAPLPEQIPGGYTAEKVGEVRWIYPSTAESEVRELMDAQREGWRELSTRLGADLGEALDIRVGLNPRDMQALAPPGARLPGYASGVAFPDSGLILLTFTAPGTFLRPNMESVLVHELSHVALHRAVDGHAVPRWFTEGVAIDQAGERSIARIRTLWDGTLRGNLLPLSELSARFPGHDAGVNLAYAQSADLVDSMLEGPSGPERFRSLIEHLRSKSNFDGAFRVAYGRSLEEFERDWRAGLSHRFGRWPSLLMGLTGVWVIGALLLVVGYMRVRREHHRTLARWAADEAPMLEAEELELATLTAAAPPPPPRIGVRASPSQAPRTAADHVLDGFAEKSRRDSKVPTVVHDGRSYTLH